MDHREHARAASRPPGRSLIRRRSHTFHRDAAPNQRRLPGSAGPRPCRATRGRGLLDHAGWPSWLCDVISSLSDLPDLRTFDCHACGASWPCTAARAQLAVLTAPTRGVLLAVVMALALETLPPEQCTGLYARFLLDLRRS